MGMASIFYLVFYLWILTARALGGYYLTCHVKGCLCRRTDSGAELYCNLNQGVFHLLESIASFLKHIKIAGTNYTVDIPDQKYDNTWSVLETLEIYGHGGNRHDLNLPVKFTRRLSRLKLLRIRNAGLVNIEKYAFINLNAMVELDLSNNEFLNVKEVEGAFSGYTANKLETLNISGIHSSKTLSPLKSMVFLPLKSLSSLDISWTKASLLKHLWTIYFQQEYITYNQMPNLVTLDISGIKSFNYLPESINCTYRIPFFDMFKHLEVLRIDYWAANELDSNDTAPALPCSNVFDFEYGCYRLPAMLKELHLTYAYAKKFYIDFEKDVCISSKLEHLSLRNLIISGPVGKITGLQHLKSIDISNTRFPFNLQLFWDMPSLEEIEASANSLYKIENETGFVDLLGKNVVLKEISLADNGFFNLPYNLFRENNFLESIDISQNRLQYLKLNLTACLHLHQLSVAHNRLKIIDSSVISHLDSLVSATNKNKVSITFEGNELTCSCGGDKLAAWIQETNVTVNKKENFTCDTTERQEDIGDYNCSVTVTNPSAPYTLKSMTVAPITKKNELSSTLGGVLGSGLCVVCFLIIVLLFKRKYCSRQVQEVQEYSLQKRIISNDVDRHISSGGEELHITSNGEDLVVISNDEEARIILTDGEPCINLDVKEPQNSAHNKFDREISRPNIARILNDNDPQKKDYPINSMQYSVCLLGDTGQDYNVSAVYHRQLSVPGPSCVLQERKSRNNDEETNKKQFPVPDSIYFIGLTETPFESNSRKPHFAAFLAYSHHDKDFVVSKLYRLLQRQLENHIPSWNKELLTILYDKNFLPGQCTMDLTREAVFSSYVTVAIVSDTFVKSSWCHYEMEAAIEAKVPIISVYLPSCDTDKFPAILKYIYHNHVRIFWPETANDLLELSDEEADIIRDLAFSISTYVKQPGT